MRRVLCVSTIVTMTACFAGCECFNDLLRIEAYKNQSLFGCHAPWQQACPPQACDPFAGQGAGFGNCADGCAGGSGCQNGGGSVDGSAQPYGAQPYMNPGYTSQPNTLQPYPAQPYPAPNGTQVPTLVPGPENYTPVR